MKTSRLITLSAAMIAAYSVMLSSSHAAAGGNGNGNGSSSSAPTKIPTIPDGQMTATPTNVQTGTYPTLRWSILYPSKVSDVAVVQPPGTLKLTQKMYVSVQPVGTGVNGLPNGSCVPATVDTSLPTDLRMSVNGGTYKQLFYGKNSDVTSAYSLYIKQHQAGDTLDFGGRYVTSAGSWSQFYTTKSSNQQVIALVNGDTPPTVTPLYKSSQLAAYLKPYLDASGKIKLGPLSVLIMMELTTTNHASTCFDYQDQVLLVTFGTGHPNNGHGNNLDGVDSSNPGKGSGGPNGAVDPSAGVDDEIR